MTLEEWFTEDAIERRTRLSSHHPNHKKSLEQLVDVWLKERGDNPSFHKRIGKVRYAFCDGGLTGRNGDEGTMGTYGVALFRKLSADTMPIYQAGGVCFPPNFNMNMDHVTNNQSEFYAVMFTLASLPPRWGCHIFTDSMNAIKWITRRDTTSADYFHLELAEFLMLRTQALLEHVDGHGKDDTLTTKGNNMVHNFATGAAKEYNRQVKEGLVRNG